jgi:hypothetical protein
MKNTPSFYTKTVSAISKSYSTNALFNLGTIINAYSHAID